MTPKLAMHFAKGLPDKAVCGADIRRGGHTPTLDGVTCKSCQRIVTGKAK